MLDQSAAITPLDLLSTASLPQPRSRLMESVFELMMRRVCFYILQKLRCKVRIRSCVNSVVAHEAALSGLPNLMLAGVVEMKPAPGSMIVCVDGDLVGALVDEICGATSSQMYVRNEMSNMEVRYGKKLIDIAISAVADICGSLMPVSGSVSHYETASGMLSIADGQTWMVSATGILETELGSGSITIIGSYAGFEPLEARMAGRIGPGGHESDEVWLGALGKISENTPIDMRVEIARGRVPLRLVETMQTGQILPISLLAEAVVMIRDVEMFRAEYGQADGHACVRIKAAAQPDDAMAWFTHLTDAVEPQQQPAPGPAKKTFENVTLSMSVELGRTHILLRDLHALRAGQVVVLDELCDEPLRVYANGRLVGMGEVVAAGRDQYRIRLTSLVESAALEEAV